MFNINVDLKKMSPNESNFFISGPAGQLEAVVAEISPTKNPIIGIICHPHPLHGGTMHNKVVSTLSRTFRELGITSLRFNYRGVGKSGGSFAEGSGETEDTLAVIEWAKEQWPQANIWLAGFSFGAYVSLRAATIANNISQLISIAPAVNHADFSHLHPKCPWLLVIAEKDTIVPADEIKKWIKTLQPPPDILTFSEATHFFDGQLVTLRQQLIDKFHHAHTI
jgi:alpha/beta superfamily hydrolase